ncbi:hypothetical protein BVX97_03450 [bacterium E08(2017)]|nr:hypothetical protein BVX97_03450 [bacterium E08(2017)]
MKKIAKVLVDTGSGLELDYVIPSEMSDSLSVGVKVTVPCGRRRADGYVVALKDESDFSDLKPIASIKDAKPMVSAKLIELAHWMASYYCCGLGKVMQTMLPAAVRKSGSGHKELLAVDLISRPTHQSKARCGASAGAESQKLTDKQQAVIEHLESNGKCLLKDLTDALNITAAPVKSLQKKGLVGIKPARVGRNPSSHKTILPTKPLALTDEQAAALDKILSTINQSSGARGMADKQPVTTLLYGVTGSGKTEVYMQAIDHALKDGAGVIVLVPEISLTPQTVSRFKSRFGDRIAVLHSHLSDGERHDEWHRIRDGEADIVIGARSAVFAPIKNLGLIVVDEEHEHSYKQEDAPRYSARDIAVMRGHMEGCTVVLGSATPALESWYNAVSGKYEMARLTKRADDRMMPAMRIVDMRVEAQAQGKPSVFSRDLINGIQARIERAEQTILFLNRRGFATSLTCQHCGYTAACDECSVSLTYHRNDDSLKCHICGFTRKVMDTCPSCNDPQFKYSGIGTQRIESILKSFFPHARIQRMDTDMTTAKNSHDRILGDFKSGRIDILVGTQMIAKGLHFPNVTLVGVVYADLSLHMPDFRASERTFQLIAQVAGRAGRGEQAGEVIVQTYTPGHTAVQLARSLDYDTFCDQELEFRKELEYPPFSHLMCITLRGKSESKVSFSASTLAKQLKKEFGDGAHVSDAVPAPLSKAKGNYRFQVMLRGKSVKLICGTVTKVLTALNLPDGVKASVDMDAVSLL